MVVLNVGKELLGSADEKNEVKKYDLDLLVLPKMTRAGHLAELRQMNSSAWPRCLVVQTVVEVVGSFVIAKFRNWTGGEGWVEV